MCLFLVYFLWVLNNHAVLGKVFVLEKRAIWVFSIDRRFLLSVLTIRIHWVADVLVSVVLLAALLVLARPLCSVELWVLVLVVGSEHLIHDLALSFISYKRG